MNSGYNYTGMAHVLRDVWAGHMYIYLLKVESTKMSDIYPVRSKQK